MEFAQACAGLGVRPITGAELTVASSAAAARAASAEPFRGNCPPGCFHLTLLVEERTRLHEPLPAADDRPRPDPGLELARAEPAPALTARRSRPRPPPRSTAACAAARRAHPGRRRGARLPLGLRPRRRPGRAHRPRQQDGSRAARPAPARSLRPRSLPGRAAAAAVARRSDPQPAPRRACRGARRAGGRHGQRPLPRSSPGAASGRARRHPPARHARVDRAVPAWQRRRLPRRPRADGRALCRAIRRPSPRPSGWPSGCASI